MTLDRESFDTYIRSEKMLLNVIHYTLNNPVKAGIVDSWKEWPYTYIDPSYTFK
jgi:putative transposase